MTVISNLKNVLKPNGVLIFTTRSQGFGYHGYPFDFWRYEVNDMNMILADLQIEKIEKDPSMPGVFVKARKPVPFTEANLSKIMLYSIVTHKRCKNISDYTIGLFKFKRILLKLLPSPLKAIVKRIIRKDKV